MDTLTDVVEALMDRLGAGFALEELDGDIRYNKKVYVGTILLEANNTQIGIYLFGNMHRISLADLADPEGFDPVVLIAEIVDAKDKWLRCHHESASIVNPIFS